jgi:hypothetical protein
MAADAPHDIDWASLGAKLSSIQADMIHAEDTKLYGADFYGEALRRLLDGLIGGPYPRYIARDEHDRLVDRYVAEHWEAEVAKVRAEYAQLLADAYRTAGRALRRRAHNAPGRYRQEGVLLAASWLDPDPAGE